MTQKFVTQDECLKKIHIPKWVLILFFTIFIALMGLFLTLVGLSASQASAAATSSSTAAINVENSLDQAEKVANSLETHIQVGAEKEKSMVSKLEDIRRELYEHRIEQKEILQKLIELETKHYSGGHAGND